MVFVALQCSFLAKIGYNFMNQPLFIQNFSGTPGNAHTEFLQIFVVLVGLLQVRGAIIMCELCIVC